MKKRFTLLQMLVHLYAWSALLRLLLDFILGNLSPNPIQDLEQRTGRHAITLLVLSLLCTPLNTLFGWKEPLKRRRALGLYAFLYATLHMLIYLDLDYGLAWSRIFQNVIEKPFILFGAVAFLMLIPLAATSFDVWKRRLQKNWKRLLHRLVYLIAPVAVLHYGLSKKGNFLQLQGDVTRPFVYGLLILTLLILRLSPVRRWFASLRTRCLLSLFRRRPA
ncbi:MAG: ferric reductase-like transmembrane domain-containing protein [Anaerolineales bacterium]